MIEFELDVEDLADTRFAVSPIAETVFSLWALRDPGSNGLHLPWLRSVRDRIPPAMAERLDAIVGQTRALPDFLTPRPASFAPTIDDELTIIRATPAQVIRRDLLAAHAPHPLPDSLRAARGSTDQITALAHELCELLQQYWELAIQPYWTPMRLFLEADMTYRAGRLATGGARLMFADIHPNLRWRRGVLSIDKMIGQHRVPAGGRGLLLIPSVFAYKPVPPVSATDPPSVAYPARGLATLWSPVPEPDATALPALLGAPRAGLLRQLDSTHSTSELARRLTVTPSAISQHLRVLHSNGLVAKARDGRRVLYRRTPLGDQLADPAR